MRIKGFLHQTSASFLVSVLKSGKLKSAALLGQPKRDYYDGTFVYLTPVDGEGIPIPFTDVGKNGAAFQFKPSLLEAYPKVFINTSQSGGPSDGQFNDRNTCRCKSTYNTISAIEGPCVKKTLEEIDAVLRFDMEYCDSGPEIGIPDEVEILPHLMNIAIHPETYQKLKDQIPPEYIPYIAK